MAHYAFLDTDNIVTEVIVGCDEDDTSHGVSGWEEWYGNFRKQKCLQTSYNTYAGVHYTNDDKGNRLPSEDQSKSFRKNYASIGYTYDEERNAFIPPKIYSSWILNEFSCQWEAPIPFPDDGYRYYWDENLGDWARKATIWDEENGGWVKIEDL
jgi:hypothetical protein